MIVLLLITVLFILISVYFFFRAEKLQRNLSVLNRETAKVQKENASLSKSIAFIGGNSEEFVKNRLQLLLDRNQSQQTVSQLSLIKPIINNYAFIFKACLMKRNTMQSTIKECFSTSEEQIYNNFISLIINQDTNLLRLWNSNNFMSYISLVETILIKFEKEDQNDKNNDVSEQMSN